MDAVNSSSLSARSLGLRLLGITVVGALLATSLPAARRHSAPTPLDADYVAALSAADRFLHSWEVQDSETGLLMLTDASKRHISENWLDDFFSAGEGLGYEIGRGKRLPDGRYSFPVTLIQANGELSRTPPHVRYSQLIIVRNGTDDWAVDKLP
jgi:hypothetical protein